MPSRTTVESSILHSRSTKITRKFITQFKMRWTAVWVSLQPSATMEPHSSTIRQHGLGLAAWEQSIALATFGSGLILDLMWRWWRLGSIFCGMTIGGASDTPTGHRRLQLMFPRLRPWCVVHIQRGA